MTDPHSFSKPEQAVVQHLELSLDVNPYQKTLRGIATWDIAVSDSAESIIFDTHFLSILQVKNAATNEDLAFTFTSENPNLGKGLIVSINKEVSKVEIIYEATPQSLALQWLAPEQTDGKKLPFLFTQSQAILARTWVPCQDSPGIRFTYNAKVQVPSEFMAVMSAVNPQEKSANGLYTFSNPHKIPSYLMALCVGDLQFQSVGNRTGVYAEPSMLQKSVYEFADMEAMLLAAEELYGPYAWGRYDVLVLPPSFPFGGMENPMLTFATPTILAGDRSLTALIAHELAHSWSGNLVTNATWNDFWLNEGFTVYFERRIMEAIYGAPYAEMLAALGYGDVLLTMNDLKETGNWKGTHLKLNLDETDPDDGMNDIAYEKGYFLLTTIEKTVGRENFDTFLMQYFEHFKFQSVTTEVFLTYLRKNLLSTDEQWQTVNPEAWIYQPGFPASFTGPVSQLFTKVKEAASDFTQTGNTQWMQQVTWSSHEWQQFLRILKSNPLTHSQLEQLDKAKAFSQSTNAEEAALWLEIAIINRYKPAYPLLRQFLVEVGRRKFIKPLYAAMSKDSNLRQMAIEIYKSARQNYHAVSIKTIDELLNYSH